MNISIIVAVSENGVIGRSGTLPWRQRADLQRFKQLTLDHTVVMGRKTYESIVARNDHPLPERRNIVLTAQPDFRAPGCEVAHSWDELEDLITPDEEVFIIGGATVYELAEPYASRLYLTEIHATVAGDVRLPRSLYWTRGWGKRAERFPADEENEYDYTFHLYERRRHRPEDFGLAPRR